MVKLVGKSVSSPKKTPSKEKSKIGTEKHQSLEEKKCYTCGEIFPLDDLETYYGKYYCASCLEEKKKKRKHKRKRKKKKTKGPHNQKNERKELSPSQINISEIIPQLISNLPKEKQFPILNEPFTAIKRKFIQWVNNIDPNDYGSQASVINRVQKHRRPRILEQVLELFWEFLHFSDNFR